MSNQGRTFSLPVDFDRHPEFLIFCDILQDSREKEQAFMLACTVVMRLWQELSYYAMLEPLGCIPLADFSGVSYRLCGGTEMPDVERALFESRMLERDKEFVFCRKFFYCNPQLDRAHCPSLVRRAERLVYYGRKRKYTKDVETKPIVFPESWHMVHGRKATPLEMNHALVVIRLVDRMFRRPERENDEFTENLIRDALTFVTSYSTEQLDAFMQVLYRRRYTVRSPRSAELIFGNIPLMLHLLDLGGFDQQARMLPPEKGNPCVLTKPPKTL